MYLALKPIHFDKWYRVGEVIPQEAIDPKQLKRILATGRVALVDSGAVPTVPQVAKKEAKAKAVEEAPKEENSVEEASSATVASLTEEEPVETSTEETAEEAPTEEIPVEEEPKKKSTKAKKAEA